MMLIIQINIKQDIFLKSYVLNDFNAFVPELNDRFYCLGYKKLRNKIIHACVI